MNIRKAAPGDLPRLLEIYNDEVSTGTATFDTQPRSCEAGRRWMEAHSADGRPLCVAQEEGEILGYVSLSDYNPKAAYAGTVELSLYIARAHRGRGVGTALMEFILTYARSHDSLHTVVSLITAGNDASLRLHERFGFRHMGTLYEAGYKFGRLLDVEYYQIILHHQ